MDTARTVNLNTLTVKKLKEMLKKHQKLPSRPHNEVAIRAIQDAIRRKKQGVVPLELTNDARRAKLEALKSIFRVRKKIPAAFSGQTIGIPIEEKKAL